MGSERESFYVESFQRTEKIVKERLAKETEEHSGWILDKVDV